jgi:dephospho-CoA kinase
MGKIIVGLIGRIASGKTIVAEHLVDQYDAVVYRFSDVLRDVLERLHKPNTRENLQALGLALRKAFEDEGILASVLKGDILRQDKRIIVVDGIRYDDEFRIVKDVGGVVVYVTAPAELRYSRVVERGTRGEKDISFEEFKASEMNETERLIDDLGGKADYVIENTGTLDELKEKVDEILEKQA